MPSAASFSFATTAPQKLAEGLRTCALNVKSPTGGLVFVSGTASYDLKRIAEQVASAWPSVPVLIASSAGVISDKGEHEGDGLAGLLFSGPRSAVACATEPNAAGFEDELSALESVTSAVVVTETSSVSTARSRAHEFLPNAVIFGGGVATEKGVAVVDANSNIRTGSIGIMGFRGPSPLLGRSHSFRALGEPVKVTKMQGTSVVELNDTPALDLISSRAKSMADPSMVVGIFVNETSALPRQSQSVDQILKTGRVRPIRGVAPDQRAVVFLETPEPGDLILLAARDPASSREQLTSMTRGLMRNSSGAAPRFALYFNCASRGKSLYGNTQVDCGILKSTLGTTPFAGMMSSLELSWNGRFSDLQLHSGVVALYTAPS